MSPMLTVFFSEGCLGGRAFPCVGEAFFALALLVFDFPAKEGIGPLWLGWSGIESAGSAGWCGWAGVLGLADAGTGRICPHCGHFALRPACSSGTCKE